MRAQFFKLYQKQTDKKSLKIKKEKFIVSWIQTFVCKPSEELAETVTKRVSYPDQSNLISWMRQAYKGSATTVRPGFS